MGIPKIAKRVWTPWGIATDIRDVSPEVKFVTTSKHGGLMVNKDALISDYARELATERDGALFFEERILMNLAILDLDLPSFDKELAANLLAKDHMEYLKMTGHDKKITESRLKEILSNQTKIRSASELDLDLIVDTKDLNNNGEWLAFTQDPSQTYVCQGKQTSDKVSENLMICCISTLISRLGVKAKHPILTESMGADLEEDLLSTINEDEGGMLNVLSVNPHDLKVDLLLTTNGKNKKNVQLNANHHDLIRKLLIEFSK